MSALTLAIATTDPRVLLAWGVTVGLCMGYLAGQAIANRAWRRAMA